MSETFHIVMKQEQAGSPHLGNKIGASCFGKMAYTCDDYVSVLQWLSNQESWKCSGGADHIVDINQVPMGMAV